MNEIWTEIENYPTYEISTLGRIRRSNGKMLKTWICKNTGYLQTGLPTRKKFNVHRLVAEAFIPKIEGKNYVNHKNGKRSDANVDNLEWVNASENVLDGFVRGRIAPFKGKFSGSHPVSKSVVSYDIQTGEIKYYASAMDAVREGFDSGCISRCCYGRNSKHKGRCWTFATDMNDSKRETA